MEEYDLLFKVDGSSECKELIQFFTEAVKNSIQNKKSLILSHTLFGLDDTIELSKTNEQKRYLQLKKYLIDSSCIYVICKTIVPDKKLPGIRKKRISLEFIPN